MGCQDHRSVWRRYRRNRLLGGQSSGAGSVNLINFAYHDDPIVTVFIPDSGSVFLNNQKSDPTFSNFSYVAEHFNWSSRSCSEELECMRNPNITALEIEDFLTTRPPRLTLSLLSTTSANFPTTQLDTSWALYLIGPPSLAATHVSAGLWRPPGFPTDYLTEEPNATKANEITYQAFSCPAYYTSTLRDQLNRTTFRFQYVENFTKSVLFGGGEHIMQQSCRSCLTHLATGEAMQDFWLAFARNSQHGLQTGGWTPVSEGYVEMFGQGNDATGTVKERVPTALLDELCTPSIMADVMGGVNAFAA